MRNPKHIVVKIGCLADGEGTAAYQIHERVNDDVPVYVRTEKVQNDPVSLRVCLRRLEMLNNEVS